MAVRSKTWVGKRSIAGMASSNLSETLEVRLLCLMCRVAGGLCDGLITLSGEYYRVCVFVCACPIVCDLETSQQGGLYLTRAVCVCVCVCVCVFTYTHIYKI